MSLFKLKEHIFINVYGVQESIPPGWESILGLLKSLQKRALTTLLTLHTHSKIHVDLIFYSILCTIKIL
jgi:hypothetical protein